MNIFLKVILVVLVFLAVSSGITKIMLMPQDVEFFGKYGFTNTIIITFGVSQLIGGILMVVSKTRVIGAIIVASRTCTSRDELSLVFFVALTSCEKVG